LSLVIRYVWDFYARQHVMLKRVFATAEASFRLSAILCCNTHFKTELRRNHSR